MTFYIKQNDTRPIITANLVDGNGAAVNLDGASVAFKMRKVGATAATVDSAATITDSSTGKVTYTWTASNTSTVGSYEGEFQVTYAVT